MQPPRRQALQLRSARALAAVRARLAAGLPHRAPALRSPAPDRQYARHHAEFAPRHSRVPQARHLLRPAGRPLLLDRAPPLQKHPHPRQLPQSDGDADNRAETARRRTAPRQSRPEARKFRHRLRWRRQPAEGSPDLLQQDWRTEKLRRQRGPAQAVLGKPDVCAPGAFDGTRQVVRNTRAAAMRLKDPTRCPRRAWKTTTRGSSRASRNQRTCGKAAPGPARHCDHLLLKNADAQTRYE